MDYSVTSSTGATVTIHHSATVKVMVSSSHPDTI